MMPCGCGGRCAPCAAGIGDASLGLGGAVADRVLQGCENRTSLGAFIAAARVEAQIKGALAGAIVGGAVVFLYLAMREKSS